MRLTDEELREVLARAEEIERASRRGDAWNAELAAVIGAAEEVGLSRQAVERALAERLNLPAAPPAAGSLAWARSADGKFYVAEVVAASADDAQVRFLRGGEQRLPVADLRPCAFLPGERVTCQWPSWGPWTCTVVSYDAGQRRVKLSDGWGSTRAFAVSDVWLAPARADIPRRSLTVMLLGAGAAVGAVIGAIVTALVMK
jgi:hypothetical protein